eukprot:1621132-Amphidinium_carterae.1
MREIDTNENSTSGLVKLLSDTDATIPPRQQSTHFVPNALELKRGNVCDCPKRVIIALLARSYRSSQRMSTELLLCKHLWLNIHGTRGELRQ